MNQKNKRNVLIFASVLVLTIALIAMVAQAAKTGSVTVTKTVSVQVVVDGKLAGVYVYSTSETYLGAALENEGLIVGERRVTGLYLITVAGVSLDATQKQRWVLTKNGEAVGTPINSTPIEDGDVFELTLTVNRKR